MTRPTCRKALEQVALSLDEAHAGLVLAADPREGLAAYLRATLEAGRLCALALGRPGAEGFAGSAPGGGWPAGLQPKEKA